MMGKPAASMQWNNTRSLAWPSLNDGWHMEAAEPYSRDAGQLARLGETLLRHEKCNEAATAFEGAEQLSPGEFRNFVSFAHCYLSLGRPEAALRVCERGGHVMPDSSDLHLLRGDALELLNRGAEARDAFEKAVATSDHAFTAAERLLSPLASDSSGARLLALCDELPPAYANCTVVRGFRAIGLSQVGRIGEANQLVDLDKHVTQIAFRPPTEFGSVEHFNELLAEEIISNPGLRYSMAYGFHRAENLDFKGARIFPVLAQFLRAAIMGFIAEFPRRGLDLILPPAPPQGFLRSAGNVVRYAERHHAHLHKFAYVSGVYHVLAPRSAKKANDQAGALVLGSCDDFTGGDGACWGRRNIRPEPGVATLFPSHIFHSVVPTHDEKPRIAVPFDLNIAVAPPISATPGFRYKWLIQQRNYKLSYEGVQS